MLKILIWLFILATFLNFKFGILRKVAYYQKPTLRNPLHIKSGLSDIERIEMSASRVETTEGKGDDTYYDLSDPINMEKAKSSNVFNFNVSFTAVVSKKPKLIVDKVSDLVRSGETLAIMGPSGAGKTTLLRCLTMEGFGGITTGTVQLNGQRMTPNLFKERCAMVGQEDYHWTFLTCRETISYAAELYHPEWSQSHITREVDLILLKMGLVSCQNTIVGNQFIHGLSGGQKRRLSVAVVLLKKLDMVFLDEPTTGLDAAASAGITTFLSDVTKRENLITIFTIHQPSSNIFNNFDRLLLLSRGKIAFSGKACDSVSYLASISHPVPDQTNPAEFMLDLVNSDFTDEASVIDILDKWESHGKIGHSQRKQSILNDSRTMNLIKAESTREVATKSDVLRQSWILLRRHGSLSYRDPMLFTGRLIFFVMATVLFAIVYVHARVRVQEQTINRFWFLNWCIGVPSNLAVISVYVFYIEFNAIRKETKNGMVNYLPYLIANSIIQLPFMFLLGLAAITISGYGIMNLNTHHFGKTWLIYSLALYTFESAAQMLALVVNNPLMGMMQYMNIWFGSFLFCGLFITITDIIWPFRIVSYIFPFRYVFQMLAYEEFTGTTFRGASPCTPGPSDITCSPRGFKCDASVLKCYGYTGSEVLDSLQGPFGVINSQDHFGEYIGYLITMIVVYKVIYFLAMSYKSQVMSLIVHEDEVALESQPKLETEKAIKPVLI